MSAAAAVLGFGRGESHVLQVATLLPRSFSPAPRRRWNRADPAPADEAVDGRVALGDGWAVRVEEVPLANVT
eukprot:16428479-Heterocapsa_arctica.AAC.1